MMLLRNAFLEEFSVLAASFPQTDERGRSGCGERIL